MMLITIPDDVPICGQESRYEQESKSANGNTNARSIRVLLSDNVLIDVDDRH